MIGKRFLTAIVVLGGCAPEFLAPDELVEEDGQRAVVCDPVMNTFPVDADHNIGYDNASCGTGTCDISCPDNNANSDWGGAHHGIDIFAYHRAPLVAVADGEVVAVGTPSSTSGLRVRLRDACGWEYYYGHMDQAVVSAGQWLSAGDIIGYMGATGTSSTHTHFNVSPDGSYYDDINPFDLLNATSGTACDVDPPTPPVTGDIVTQATGCGWMGANTGLNPGTSIASCDGRFLLSMQTDGNLVLYQGWTALWSTGTGGNPGSYAVMQGDGNFVVYHPWGTALWHTYTNGFNDAGFAVQDDGNLVIYWGWGSVWNSGTCCH